MSRFSQEASQLTTFDTEQLNDVIQIDWTGLNRECGDIEDAVSTTKLLYIERFDRAEIKFKFEVFKKLKKFQPNTTFVYFIILL